ncbi:hypothetical protein HB884_14985 [Listeria booriae]|uniref:hypothetical protein n=1 Tax=Listeria booriae TaxID=1552123 RepID=UPI001628C2F6|nr:hypothetical protein [Listeria booriae]MBC1525511.1 hypothetical protein [Listeria booriae]MBC2258628.1 hypothetical protein [Listeria booriae]
MTFSEGVKFPKGWLLKLDPEAPNVTSNFANTNIICRHNTPKGTQLNPDSQLRPIHRRKSH